ncbi:hypothetical protein RRG08_006365 [Elysia crispata]|uniref:PH domain-containing protein n=1 Tax=Elysia crispata TaxID=231223 RepID=A0AAE1DCW2_9GAST|nr:hypothetical protein RRG08_006365 [Elysia crispata]
MQIQERYLFLFTDLLLVAKQKSSTAFKLKQRVELCDMWIASCIEEVSETTRPSEKSFVLGWPTTNVVATFPTDQLKADWLQKLSERITEEKLRDEGKTLQLKVSPRDIESASGQYCQMTINNETQAKDVLHTCLRQLNVSESECSNYQLWVISGKEGSPYPLIDLFIAPVTWEGFVGLCPQGLNLSKNRDSILKTNVGARKNHLKLGYRPRLDAGRMTTDTPIEKIEELFTFTHSPPYITLFVPCPSLDEDLAISDVALWRVLVVSTLRQTFWASALSIPRRVSLSFVIGGLHRRRRG